ncbi:Protein kinase-like domain protein [Fusarium austroafricanum]|uniref:Protein kinase-like domain protein n=1 Tax=Fusarium austroafricanum TaxID=2364996 RepID=A0A8H4JZA1_9HYPO|nr:Protein kinase-like domain protein [Fusarium austroafricanum]
MSTVYQVYSLESAIADFFTKTSATRLECDAKAQQLAGGQIVPVEIQGDCSYTVYAGTNYEFVVQFRLRSLALKTETSTLASSIYGSLAPRLKFSGQLGSDGQDEKEPLFIYLINRIRGTTYLEFKLAHDWSSFEACKWRMNTMEDVARFFATSWNAPQKVDAAYRRQLREEFTNDLSRLLSALPHRFHQIIQNCLQSIDDVLSLPMVLLHRDFGESNIMVDEACHLTGVIDWAEAETRPFGMNLHSIQFLTGELNFRKGWIPHQDHDVLCCAFWRIFVQAVGVSEDTIRTIKTARIIGLLLSRGFTSRLANNPEPIPIGNDERGRYNMLFLDGLLLDPATKFDGVPS